MKKYFISVRKFLENNKIFFEVILASSLSFMAIYVSYKANEIAENQTAIMEQENLPQIEIRYNQELNETTKSYENDHLLFYNRAGKLSNFDFESYSFLQVNLLDDIENDTIRVPIEGYLNYRGNLTGESEGLVFEIDNRNNNQKVLELNKYFSGFALIDVITMIKVSYVDIFDIKHSEYYKSDPFIEKVSFDDWNKYIKIHKNHQKTFFFPKINEIDVKKEIINQKKRIEDLSR